MSYEELYDKYVRLFADFENYKKTSKKTLIQSIDNAKDEMILQFLPIIDDIMFGGAFDEGMKNILTKLDNILNLIGIERYGKNGDMFDGEIYEAVFTTNDECFENNQITNVVKYGYKYNGRIIRYASVSVNKRE